MATTALTAQRGVNLVEASALENDWLFRPVLLHDFGVDAEMELCDGGEATGRLVAVQIKAGPSYFRSKTPDGWWFSVDKRHAAYWLNHSLPVFVVLVDVQSGTAYWERVTKRTLRPAGKNFKMLVPRVQTLANYRTEWAAVAMDLAAEALQSLQPNLGLLPSTVGRLVSTALESDSYAAVLAMTLAEGRFESGKVVADLLANPPRSMGPEKVALWKIVSVYAFEHGHHSLAADALERCAEHASDAAKVLTDAGFMTVLVDRPRAQRLAAAALTVKSGFEPAKLLEFRLTWGPKAIEEQLAGRGPDIDFDKSRTEVQVLLFLLEIAGADGHLTRAVGIAEELLALAPGNTGAELIASQTYLRRSRTTDAHKGDLRRSASLAADAVDDRHKWDGYTSGFLEQLLQVLSLEGNYLEVERRSNPTPLGLATDVEVSRSEVARYALVSGTLLGRLGQRDEILRRISSTEERELLTMEFPAKGVSPSSPERTRVWRAKLDRALAAEDGASIDHSLRMLALEGIYFPDQSRRLVELGWVDADYPDLLEAVALARTDLDSALPALRRLASKDIAASHYLMNALSSGQRFIEAAKVCADATERFNSPELISENVNLLRAAGDEDAAEALAQSALVRGDFIGRDRAAILRFLMVRSFARKDWKAAVLAGRGALEALGFVEPEIGWNLVAALLNQQARATAAEFIRESRLPVESVEEAGMWLTVFPAADWDTVALTEAVTLALRFEDDPNISAAFLSRIASLGPSEHDDEHEDLHVRAMNMLAEHVKKFGDQSPIKFIPADVDSISELLRTQSEQVQSSIDTATLMYRLGRIPTGAYANSLHRPYSFVVLQKPFGFIASGAFPDETHKLEVDAATDALGKLVIVDASTLALISQLDDIESLTSEFSSVIVHPATISDVYDGIAETESLARSAGSMGWDSGAGRPVFIEYSEDDHARFLTDGGTLRRGLKVASVGNNVPLKTSPIGALPKVAESWAGCIQLAVDSSGCVWSDDAAQRAVAMAMGVPTFGTPALLEAICRRDIERNSELADRAIAILRDRQLTLARLGAVDLPLSAEDFNLIAEEESWSGQVSSLPLSRASWWSWTDTPLSRIREILSEVNERNPESLNNWRARAMTGWAIYWSADPQRALVALSTLALLPVSDVPHLESASTGLHIARAVAQGLGLPDPIDALVLGAEFLASESLLVDAADLVRDVLRRVQRENAEDANTDTAQG